jgi:hypothetical protein
MALAALYPPKGLTSVAFALAAISLLPVTLAQTPASALHDMDENRLREIRPRLQELTDQGLHSRREAIRLDGRDRLWIDL